MTEDEITYVDRDGFADEFDEELEAQIDIEYILDMPGDIVETNGDIRDEGDSVEWRFHDHRDVEEFQATSEREDDFLPGFGVAAGVIALVAFLGAAGLARRRPIAS